MNESIQYVIYIKANLDRLWNALTNPELTERYWGGTRIESDWRIGSTIVYRRNGTATYEHMILAIEPPHRLYQTFHPLLGEFEREPPSFVNIALLESGGIVRLAVVHDGFPPHSRVAAACREEWPMILCSLKTFMETGEPLPAVLFAKW